MRGQMHKGFGEVTWRKETSLKTKT